MTTNTLSPGTPGDDERRRNIEELLINLPLIKSLTTSYRFVMNVNTRKVHLTSNTCIAAVNMKEKRRFYTDHVPPDGRFCAFCEKQFVKFREEKLRDNA